MAWQKEYWYRKNYLALAAGGEFILTLLQLEKWFKYHNQDRAIEAAFSLVLTIVLMVGHREYKSVQKYREAMRKLNLGEHYGVAPQ